ncbi:16S rRNA (cytosine(1402)-N(4))-methyltransferase RsmH [Candidatus Saccharibacteria bacterium]|nr:16S rRNA (cytosine(1402)-N(4))-methyltransferase RsmH [Candidatus Saccharibacteria bacterium]
MSIKEHPPQSNNNDSSTLHIPVLLQSTLTALKPKPGESYLDLTAGYGGHASRVLSATQEYTTSVLVDRDINAITYLRQSYDWPVRLLHTDFAQAAKQLVSEGAAFDIILADLGVSSPQLDKSERGFSFLRNGPLDMRMDSRLDVTAAKVVNTYSADALKKIIVRYGEESPSVAKRIVDGILAGRPYSTTETLATAIEQSLGGRRGKKKHPATRTFQALRIEVNQELQQVENLLPLIPKLLNKGGRVGIISFHSLEDRLIKQYFKEQADSGYEAELQILTKKPLDGATYDVHNPRSRSAKLRAAVKK